MTLSFKQKAEVSEDISEIDKINGIIFGRASDYSNEEKIELEKEILRILKEFKKEDLNIVTNVDFGHTDPQIILPSGCKLKISK